MFHFFRKKPGLQEMENSLRVAEAVFANVQAVMVTDAQRIILRANKAFCELMGYTEAEIIGKTPWMFRSDHHDDAFYAAMLRSVELSGHWEGEIWDRHKNGTVFPKWMTITAVTDPAGTLHNFVATYLDRSERLQAEAEIRQMALYDRLTGLPNRSLFTERVQQVQAESSADGEYGAVLLLDLDNFKSYNDSEGFRAGDRLLQQVGQLMAGQLPDEAGLARLGGDEFAILLPNLGVDRTRAAAHVDQLCKQLLQALHETVPGYQIRASIGISLFSGSARSVDELLQRAEMAMYGAKNNGGDSARFFDDALKQAISERIFLERGLREGIDSGQLELYYQPQIRQGEENDFCTGAEALVRWHHPERGLISPAQFIPLAEETGLILPLGSWVLEQACRQLASWQQASRTARLSLAVNVSAVQFLEAGFVERLKELLNANGVPADRLKLELTESMLVDRPEQIVAIMEELRCLGLRFSLDDFGTGYSSLSYLKRLPLDQLKIDQSFVRDLEQDANDMAIARSVTALAHALDLEVIAEGVENRVQRDLLAGMGCHDWQGYYFSRPLSWPDFEAYLQHPPG